ncbi:MAG: hypothetical protein WC992_00395 [Acholeplasmataceae bacterium]
MARSTAWKQLERDAGQYFGVMRNIGSGTMGRADHEAGDAHHPALFLEMKNRKEYAAVTAALLRCRQAAAKEGRLGILLFDNALVTHSDDFGRLGELLTASMLGDPTSLCPAVLYTDKMRQIRSETPARLRKEFAALGDAEQLAPRYDRQCAVLIFRSPRSRGFALALRPANLGFVWRWHLAGAKLVEERGGPMSAVWHESAAEFKNQLDRFQHRWSPPRKRKNNE